MISDLGKKQSLLCSMAAVAAFAFTPLSTAEAVLCEERCHLTIPQGITLKCLRISQGARASLSSQKHITQEGCMTKSSFLPSI